ncbi:hypothetical protein NRZ31_00765 [Aeromonas dhakensis]|uniref:hypothetical protein n=1 Tax=Aeromonas dhakensis TaxID=196024 RepID=UPI00227BE40F|nr:hypothetical protein [Aeromonas dhakensis]WAF99327.1 hypothetical protein NRZ31_00765 [Aeromonas dhakensis]
MEFIKAYSSNEGICCDIVLECFGNEPIEIINLECYELDEKFKEEVRCIYENQLDIYRSVIAGIIKYVRKKSDNNNLKLMKIYTSHDVEREFGLLFSWDGDTEHGIGVRIRSDGVVIDVGPAETSFI